MLQSKVIESVLLAGAECALGEFIIMEFISLGIPVKILIRNTDTAKKFTHCNVEFIVASATQPELLKGQFNNISTIISIPNFTKKRSLFDRYVDYHINCNLLTEGQKEGVQKFIYLCNSKFGFFKRNKALALRNNFIEQLNSSKINHTVINIDKAITNYNSLLRLKSKNVAVDQTEVKKLALDCVNAVVKNTPVEA